MSHYVEAAEFLQKADHIPVIDVRTPSEFEKGHMPSALNIPLFSDEERAQVGTSYKKKGRTEAVLEGLELIGPRLREIAQKGLESAGNRQLLLYCWRGGMRSASMAWLFEQAGIRCSLLKGGYKAYRTLVREELEQPRHILILGGMTGSGKTHVLEKMAEEGHQVVDLEALACHKGSAFGSLGQERQPETEHFSNLLHHCLRGTDSRKPLWVEDESHSIGSVFIPEEFFKRMRQAPVIALDIERAVRIPLLADEYAVFPGETLIERLHKIEKRLGRQHAKRAIQAVEAEDYATAINISLIYYDRTYHYGLEKTGRKVFYLPSDTVDPEVNCQRVLEKAEKEGLLNADF